jgi:TetR/AcrR family transcriptional repressor of nem operon
MSPLACESEMPRPREFDEAAALDVAVACFWSRGFESTSMRDLADQMGLTSASVYNAFGDKRALFRRALDHYIGSTFAELSHRLETTLPPYDAIETFFHDVIDRSLADPGRKGCMLVNSGMELAPHDPEFQQVVALVLKQVEAFFVRLIRAGQSDGTITKSQPAADLARMLLGSFLGTRVLARTRPEPKLLRGAVRPILFLLKVS